jgi:thiosulfate dehydrogenase [quinone] large subunit
MTVREQRSIAPRPNETISSRNSFQGKDWFGWNPSLMKSAMRIIFGIIWGIDGALKFWPGFAQTMPSMMANVSSGQPPFLTGWFTFWTNLVLSNPPMFAYTQGIVELTISIALILGLMRKVVYIGGLLMSLVIWAVPEGFGGPYGPGSTDIGTGIVYAFAFALLIVISAAYGTTSRLSLDWYMEQKWPWWKKIAEIRGAPPSPPKFRKK